MANQENPYEVRRQRWVEFIWCCSTMKKNIPNDVVKFICHWMPVDFGKFYVDDVHHKHYLDIILLPARFSIIEGQLIWRAPKKNYRFGFDDNDLVKTLYNSHGCPHCLGPVSKYKDVCLFCGEKVYEQTVITKRVLEGRNILI